MNILGTEEKGIFRNKKVFVRCDFDVSFNTDGSIADKTRIDRCLPTIGYLLSEGARVTLATKIGDPEKGRISCRSLLPYLRTKNGLKDLQFVSDYPGTDAILEIESLNSGRTLLLENLRFFLEEDSEKHPEFAQKYSRYFDFYVNEAFAMSSCNKHDSSVCELPKHLLAFAGFNLAKEIDVLSRIVQNPSRPSIFVVGGAKIESKLSVINKFANIADKIFIGGKLVSDPKAQEFTRFQNIQLCQLAKSGSDISENSVMEIVNYLSEQKDGTVVWAGPLGKFEDSKYEKGTKIVANAIANFVGYKVAGGGDTISAISKFKLTNKFDFISTGGGAMLSFLAEEELPGISALN